MAMLKVFGDFKSGNCYKVKLLLDQLAIPHAWEHVDILKKQTQTPAYRAKNPNGKIPLLALGDDVFLAESNAILHYLAEGSALLPGDRLEHAQVLQWQFFEQYSHEPYIAVARFIVRYLGKPRELEQKLAEKMQPGYGALKVMEQHLTEHTFFLGERYTIADISLYAYTHVAHEGGFDLAPFPAIRAWLMRVEREPGYISMSSLLQHPT